MRTLVWTRMQAAGGETLDHIVMRKEAERNAGAGVFWWGIGTSLGLAVEKAASSNGNELPVLFSKQLSKPLKKDSEPDHVCIWNKWKTKSGHSGRIPDHVLVTGASVPTDNYYALVCRSDKQLRLSDHGPFDPKHCQTMSGKVPGASQVTCLIQCKSDAYNAGPYKVGFRAILIRPWAVQLTEGRQLTSTERNELASYRPGDDWLALVRRLRQRETEPSVGRNRSTA